MAVFVFERPRGAAPRLWIERGGGIPELVAPLRVHRQRWGDVYDCGAGADGCHLLAATLLHRAGLSTVWATELAAAFVEQFLLPIKSPVWRVSLPTVEEIGIALVAEHADELTERLCRRSDRRPPAPQRGRAPRHD